MFDVEDYPSLSKADINGITPKWIEDRANDGYGEEAFVWRQMVMGGLSGVAEDSLAELLLSRAKGPNSDASIKLTEQKIGPVKSFFLPYFLRGKEDVINANAFVIESAEVNGNAGSTVDGTTFSAGSWAITVTNTNSEWGSNLPNLENMFLPGESVIVNNLSDSGAVQRPVMKVEHAINANSGGVEKATVYLAPPFTDAEWGALTSDQKAVYQPGAKSVVILGTNSVSDFESYCHNQPAFLSQRVHAYFPQTSRFTRSWDEEYESYLKYILEGNVNEYLRRFRVLPLAEQNRRMYDTYRRKWINSVFWGDVSNQQQSVEGYKSMPHITDPRTGTFIHYKSESTGLYRQLQACNRVIDNQGSRLNFNTVEELLYQLKRHRETRKSMTVEDIDVFTDRHNATRIESLMHRYYQKKYGVTTYVKYENDEPLRINTGSKNHRTLWNKKSYELPDINVVLHVFVHNWFSDNRLHYDPSIRSASNMMWFIDWSDFTLGILETNKRKSETPDIDTDPDFACTMKANKTFHDMESTTWCPFVGEESQHLIIENFSDDCPVFTAQTCAAQESSTSASVEA